MGLDLPLSRPTIGRLQGYVPEPQYPVGPEPTLEDTYEEHWGSAWGEHLQQQRADRLTPTASPAPVPTLPLGSPMGQLLPGLQMAPEEIARQREEMFQPNANTLAGRFAESLRYHEKPTFGSISQRYGIEEKPGMRVPVEHAPGAPLPVQALLGTASVLEGFARPITEPLEVLAQTGGEAVFERKMPTVLQGGPEGGYQASLEAFGERGLLAQIGLGVLFDPLVIAKMFTIPLKASRATSRSLIRSRLAKQAPLGTPSKVIEDATDEMLERLPPPEYTQIGPEKVPAGREMLGRPTVPAGGTPIRRMGDEMTPPTTARTEPGDVAGRLSEEPGAVGGYFRDRPKRIANKAAFEDFVQDNIQPLWFREHGDFPIWTAHKRGDDYLLEINSAGWEQRALDIGLEPVEIGKGTSDWYRIPMLAEPELTARAAPEFVEDVGLGPRRTQGRGRGLTGAGGAGSPIGRAVDPLEPDRFGLLSSITGAKKPEMIGSFGDDAIDDVPDMIGDMVMDATDGSVVKFSSPKLHEVFGIGDIVVGLSKVESLSSAVKSMGLRTPVVRGVMRAAKMAPENMYATPAFEMRASSQTRITSVAAAISRDVMGLVDRTFTGKLRLDSKDRIVGLAGIDPTIPFAPTIQDVAARLPIYREAIAAINPRALAALDEISGAMAKFDEVNTSLGLDIGRRQDVMEGGFYLHRGSPRPQGVQRYTIPLETSFKGKPGFTKPAPHKSMAEGIEGTVDEAGVVTRYDYPNLRDAISTYVREVGELGTDTFVGNYLKVVEVDGVRLGITKAESVPKLLRQRVNKMRSQLRTARETLRNNSIRSPIVAREGAKLVRLADRAANQAQQEAVGFGGKVADREAELAAEKLFFIPGELAEVRKDVNDTFEFARALAEDIGKNAKDLRLARGELKGVDLALVKEMEELTNAVDGAENYLKSNLFAQESRLAPTEYFAGIERIAEIDKRADVLMDKAGKLGNKVDELIVKGELMDEYDDAAREGFAVGRQHERFLLERNVIMGRLSREIKVMQREQKRLDRLADAAKQRATQAGEKVSGNVNKIDAKSAAARRRIESLQDDLDSISDEWHAVTAGSPKDAQVIPLPGLSGHYFPDALANAARSYLAETAVERAAGPVIRAWNSMYRGIRATADNSGPTIQGLLGLASNPASWGKALHLSYAAWGFVPKGGRIGERSIDAFVRHFDESRQAAGRLTADMWGARGLRIAGADTEFQLGAGLGRAPVIRNANRAFGAFGDAMRMEWADDILEDELRRRTMQEIIDSGDLERIAKGVNGATGWSENRFAGSLGDLVLFAPRFFQARLENVGRTMASLRDPRILAEAIPFSPVKATNIPIDQRIASRSMLRMMAYGTMITMGVNEMRGEKTEFSPVRKLADGTWVKNSNFMRMKNVFGRDVSIFGPYDSLVGMAATVAAKAYSGEGIEKLYGPHEAMRSLASGTVANAWDLLSGSTAVGERVRDTPEQTTKRIMENFTPFAGAEVDDLAKDFWEKSREGDVVGATGTAAFAVGVEFSGIKSAPKSAGEQYNTKAIQELARMESSGQFDDLSEDNKRDLDKALKEENIHLAPPSVKAEVEKIAKVLELKMTHQEEQLKYNSPMAHYMKDVRETTDLYREDVNELAAAKGYNLLEDHKPENLDANGIPITSLGTGRDFRLQAPELAQNLKATLAEKRKFHQDAVDYAAKKRAGNDEREQSIQQEAIQFYIDTIYGDTTLEDPITGEYDFERADKLKEAFKEKYPGKIDEVEDHLHRNEHPLQQMLRRDRETLKAYWDVPDTVIDELPDSVSGPYRKWRDADPTEKAFLATFDPTISIVNSLVDLIRTAMKKAQPEVGTALRNWEYSTSLEGAAEVSDLANQLSPEFIDDLLSSMGIAVPVTAPTGLPAPAAIPAPALEPAGALPTR